MERCRRNVRILEPASEGLGDRAAPGRAAVPAERIEERPGRVGDEPGPRHRGVAAQERIDHAEDRRVGVRTGARLGRLDRREPRLHRPGRPRRVTGHHVVRDRARAGDQPGAGGGRERLVLVGRSAERGEEAHRARTRPERSARRRAGGVPLAHEVRSDPVEERAVGASERAGVAQRLGPAVGLQQRPRPAERVEHARHQ
jgi:hypothetical protein